MLDRRQQEKGHVVLAQIIKSPKQENMPCLPLNISILQPKKRVLFLHPSRDECFVTKIENWISIVPKIKFSYSQLKMYQQRTDECHLFEF